MNMIAQPSKPAALEGMPVVDADTHICEPYDLWTSRVSGSYKDRVPQVKDIDGTLMWVMEGDHVMGPAVPSSAIRRDGSKSLGLDFVNLPVEDFFLGGREVKPRLAYMDEAGITAQIAYPNLLGFGNQKAMGVDPELRLVVTQVYNDAMAEMQRESGDRIFPMALMPWWDIKQSVAEAERCHKMGLRGINTNTDPQNQGFPELGDAHWSPLWDACSDLSLPVNFHIGAGFDSAAWFGEGVWQSLDSYRKLAFGGTIMFMGNFKILANMMLSGFLENYPKLKIVSVESGVGWIPFMLEALEFQMAEAGAKYRMSPWEVFQQNIYACSWFEKAHIVHSARAIGVDNVLWETDFPHPVCLYPDALNYVAPAAEAFSAEERRKIFGGNAARIYNLPV